MSVEADETGSMNTPTPESAHAAGPADFVPFSQRALSGKVALVAGAAHGAGRAEAHVCDHLDPARISRSIGQIEADHGRLDILVNDIGGEVYVEWGTPFGETVLDTEMRLFRAGLLTHLHTAHAALPLLARNPGGLHIEITDGTAEFNASHYRENVFLDRTKKAVSRLAFGLDHELGKVEATAVAITPGWLRSPRRLICSVVPLSHWPLIPTGTASTRRRRTPTDWPSTADSMTSTVRDPIRGASSPPSRTTLRRIPASSVDRPGECGFRTCRIRLGTGPGSR